jgi:hypothetical protein
MGAYPINESVLHLSYTCSGLLVIVVSPKMALQFKEVILASLMC